MGVLDTDASKGIWDRKSEGNLSIRVYALYIGVFFVWTILAVGFGIKISIEWRWTFLLSLGTFLGAIGGIAIFSQSKKPSTSFVGITILSFFLGITLGPILAYYNSMIVLQALSLTFMITIVMSILGILFPKIIQKAAGLLFVGLVFLLIFYVAEFFLVLFRVPPNLTVLDWLAAGIFTLYIWYDWSKAIGLPRTVNNAIDSAGALIVDVVNLFLTLLRIIARSS